jgi:hypothetical protein
MHATKTDGSTNLEVVDRTNIDTVSKITFANSPYI